MGRILVHEFITVDGVFGDPHWTADFPWADEMGTAIGQVMAASESILLGRVTYQMFAPAWSTRTAAEDPGAPFMNESPKYVVSATLHETEWNNSHIVDGYSRDALQSLKDRSERDIYVSGSGTLVRAMLHDGLVDELHLFVYPLVLGSGQRLFSEEGVAHQLSLVASESFGNGVVHLAYRQR